MGSRFSTKRLTLTMERKDRNASMPCRAEKPAYSAMLIGPLRFLADTSPVATFQSSRTVSADMSQVLPHGLADGREHAVALARAHVLGDGRRRRRLHADPADEPPALALGLDLDRHHDPLARALDRELERSPGGRLHELHQRRRSPRPARRRPRRSGRRACRPARSAGLPARILPTRAGTRRIPEFESEPRQQRAGLGERHGAAFDPQRARRGCARPARALRARCVPPSIRRSRIASITASRPRGRSVADRDDFVARDQARAGGNGVRRHFAEHGLQRRHPGDEQHPVGDDREQEVGERPREQHQDSLPDRLAVVGRRQVRRRRPDLPARRGV